MGVFVGMILSASRRTDIPAFYGQWFMNRIRAGEVLVRNPVNASQVSRIPLTPGNVDCIVFWTKDAGPMLQYLDELDGAGFFYYFLFTVNPYGNDIEKNIASLPARLETFKELSGRIGSGRVIWRYDPVIITDKYDAEFHIGAFGRIAGQLSGYTGKCVFSFLEEYRKIKRNMEKAGLRTPSDSIKRDVAGGFSRLSVSNSIKLASCALDADFTDLGIEKNRCIDDSLIEAISGRRLKMKKDLSQRKFCGCIESKDIGTYNSCAGGCLYCYANIDKESASRKAGAHDPASPMLCDELRGGETVSLYRKIRSLETKNEQIDLF